MRAAVYTRVSTDEQAKNDKESLTGQRDSQLAIAQGMGAEVFKVYTAAGYSGALLDENPFLMELLDDARARRFDALFVREIDRLARDTLVLANVLKVLADVDIAIYENGKEWRPSDDSQRLVLDIIGSVAAFEKRRIGKRMRRGLIPRLKEGKSFTMGSPPYGYGYDKLSKTAHVIEEQARTVVTIFEWYTSGIGSVEIAQRLNGGGVPSPRAHQGWTKGIWHTREIISIIGNPCYTGKGLWGKRTGKLGVFEVPFPPIVDAELWQRAQTWRERRGYAPRQTRVWLLQGRLTCAVCGRAYRCHTSTDRKGGVYLYYRCAWKFSSVTPQDKTPCPNCDPNLHKDALESKAWRELTTALRTPALEERYRHLLRQTLSEQTKPAQGDDHAERIQAKERERERVVALYRRGLISDKETEQELNQVRDEIAALQRLQAERHAAVSPLEIERQMVAWQAWRMDFADVLAQMTAAERAEFIAALGLKGTVEPEHIVMRGALPPSLLCGGSS
jgi:site-specific DNA recombinase